MKEMKEQITSIFREMTPKKLLREFIIIASSSFVGSFAIQCIMIPAGITSGGLPGILRIITYFIPVNFSIATFIGTSIVIILTWIFLGWIDVSKILFLSMAYPIWLAILEATNIALLGEGDQLLAAIYVGVLYGIATGIGYIGGYASGGTDSLVRIVKKKLLRHVPVSTIMLAMDGTIVLISAFIFDTKVALLALITTYLCSQVTGMVMMGINGKFVRVDIITSKPEEVTEYILHTVSRGVTSYECVGEFTGQARKQMYTICTPKQSLEIKAYLAKTDRAAFVSVMALDAVWGLGRGFTHIEDE